jgi:hypothetical protein
MKHLAWHIQIYALPPQQFDGRMRALKRAAVDDVPSVTNCSFRLESSAVGTDSLCSELLCPFLFSDDKEANCHTLFLCGERLDHR